MSGDEPRRSVRSNKGQHKNASTSPAPAPKPIKASKAKSSKKSLEPEPEPEDEDEDEEDEEIRCICGNSDRKDKRPFIACDACSVWQHNICMGIPDDEDDVPEHYFCELCRPEEHQETLRALSLHEKIWETRNKIYQNERKMSKNRKNRSKPGGEATPGWLKKDLPVSETSQTTEHPTNESTTSAKEEPVAQDGGQESGTKRKREETKEEEEEDSLDQTDKTNDKSLQNDRQEKRRKSSVIDSKAAMDPETALVSLDQLPPDRKKVATALSQIIFNDVLERVKTSAFVMPEGQSAKSIGEHWAVRIEYALQVNHGNTKAAAYITQFRALLANLKRNHSLLERLLDHSLTPDQLSVMPTNEMASEELQRERAELEQALDRQAVAISEEGPKYRQDHKGYHAIEDETRHLSDNRPPTPLPTTAASGSPPDKDVQAPRQSQSQEPSGSPTISRQQHLDDDEKQAADHSTEQQASGQQFDMNNIWAKTAQSPTANTTTPQGVRRSSQIAPRRSNSVQIAPTQSVGAKDDPDVDRMLEDNDEAYSPIATTSEDTIVWRGKLVQNGEDTAPVLNARFVAGRDLVGTVSWQDLLPTALSIDGRLQIQKAEDYLCGLRWSSSSDVSVLSLTPHDNAEAFNKAFEYFHSRQRYAVVEKGKPPMVKELYIIPVEIGSHLPEHIEMLEHCTIKKPVEERLLLASLTVVRAPEEMTSVPADTTPNQQTPSGVNGSIPHHVRHSLSGPAGSPINGQTPFSPSNNGLPVAGYGANTNGAPSPATASYGQNSFPPNPYGAPMQQANPLYMSPQQGQGSTQGPDPRVNEILGDLQFTPTASQIIRASPHITPQQLHSMRQILIDNPHTRNDIAAFQAILSG